MIDVAVSELMYLLGAKKRQELISMFGISYTTFSRCRKSERFTRSFLTAIDRSPYREQCKGWLDKYSNLFVKRL